MMIIMEPHSYVRIVILGMGIIKNTRNGKTHLLSPHYIVGRSPRSHLCLSNPRVSGTHARLDWYKGQWVVYDLASTNGSYIDHQRLNKGEHRTVIVGALMAFGDPRNVYELVEDGPPTAFAVNQHGTRVFAEGDRLSLPNSLTPKSVIVRDGIDWYLDCQPRQRLEDQSVLSLDGETWTLNLPRFCEPTTEAAQHTLRLADVTLRFLVSSDCEHVDLELVTGSTTTRMRQHVYWYTLLILADARRRELAQGIPESDAGWMDVKRLFRELRGCQRPADVLNHHVFRIKKAFRNANVHDSDRIIERRTALRQIRTSVNLIEIKGAWH